MNLILQIKTFLYHSKSAINLPLIVGASENNKFIYLSNGYKN